MSELSLQGRLAAQREQMETRAPIDLDIPGYTGIIAGRFHVLNFRKEVAIEERIQKNPAVKEFADQLLYVAADKLINACDGLYELSEIGDVTLVINGQERKAKDLNARFNAEAARELFGCELPEKATAREAMMAIFPDEGNIIALFRALEQASGAQTVEFRGELGED